MDKEYPLVSIIVPVYNVQSYLVDCLDSILNQTYKNIEVIAVDDGSIDESPHILKTYEQTNENMHIYLETINKGQAAARNIGLENAKGKYILFVDSDDFIEADTVKHSVEKLEKENVDFVRFNAKSFSENESLIKESEYNFELYLKENVIYEKPNFKNVYLSFSPSPVLYMFNRNIIIKNNLSFKERIIHEDELFSSDLFLYAKSCLYINQPFYNRRYREGSTMTEDSKAQKKYSFDSYIKIIQEYKKLLKKDDFKKEERNFLKYRINSLFIPLLDYNIDNDYKENQLKKVKEKKLYYTKMYKNYIRMLKLTSIIKKRL